MNSSIYIKRDAQATGAAINFYVFVDNNKIGEVANGQTEVFPISSGTHTVFIKTWNNRISPELQIECPKDTPVFLTCKFSAWGKLLLNNETPPALANQQGHSLLGAIQKKSNLYTEMKQGLNWFYIISGLSILNSLIYLLGIPINFIIGLGITQVTDGIVSEIAKGLPEDSQMLFRLIGLLINLLIAGTFYIAGLLGQRKHAWAVILGILFYILDGVIFLVVGEWIAVGFHVFVLWNLWRGLQATIKLRDLDNNFMNNENFA